MEKPIRLAPLSPYEGLELRVKVKVEGGAVSGSDSRAEVTGGGAPTALIERPLVVNEAAPSFGVEEFTLQPEEEGGEADTHAGSHPFQLTTTFALNQTADTLRPPALPRDLDFRLPPGLLGNATALPQCSELAFAHVNEGTNSCPSNTAIGVVVVVASTSPGREEHFTVPVFNLAPAIGEPARFGFFAVKAAVVLDTSVRTGEDYGATFSLENITEVANFSSGTITFWGVPGDPRHNESRGWGCLLGGHYAEVSGQACGPSNESHPPAFLTLPTSCTEPFAATLEGDSWPRKADSASEPQSVPLPATTYSLADSLGRMLGITGCNQLSFDPSLSVAPGTSQAGAPSGYEIAVQIPQDESPEGRATPDLKDTTITLPRGTVISPSSADGLEGCSEAQVALHSATAPSCQDASIIGTAQIGTPLLPAPLQGHLYLAQPDANPFGSLLALYLVAEAGGIQVKLAGEIQADPITGQLTAHFPQDPQLPFSELRLRFNGGSRAVLANPRTCGTATATSQLTSYALAAPVSPSSSFEVTDCPTSEFKPTLNAGTINNRAGASSPFSLVFSRGDQDQDLSAIGIEAPPGLLGMLSNVPLCPEPQAAEGACAQASQVGTVTVGAGPGPEPIYLPQPGRPQNPVYLTGSYNGEPFGLAIVISVDAGPFDLGTKVIRASIAVNPITAALTITTDPMPQILRGIPLQLKTVHLKIDRAGFIFNPTSCNPLLVTARIQSTLGTSATVANHFQAADCAGLKFAPKLTALTYGNGEFTGHGASLHVKITTGTGQANIRSLKLDLPQKLPARLETIQKACPERVFRQNPAACPKASVIGSATVATPVLGVAMRGPAILVSHGGRAFPDMVLVLQAQGVRIDLTGAMFVDQHNITSTTFRTIPDVPIRRLDLVLPEGKSSVLAASASLCSGRLHILTAITGQNGARVKPTVKVAVAGCKHKKKRHPKKKRHAARRRST